MARPRWVPEIVVFVSLSVATCIMLRAFTWYPRLLTFQSSNKATKKNFNVLIVAHGRSGSSFLGQIFNNHPEVFYIYEPLITFQLTTMRESALYEQSAKRLLDDIFNCRFRQQTEFLSFMSHLPLNRFSSHALTTPYCRNMTDAKSNTTFVHCKDLDPLLTSLSCTLHKHIVVKVLIHRLSPSLNVDQIAPLLNSGGKLKIIHLVRDPRAVIASLDRVGWTLNKSVVNAASTDLPLFASLAHKLCLDMVQSLGFSLLAEAKFPRSYKLLRYEDLVRSPLNVSQDLFDFAGIPMTAQVKNYVINSTSSYDRSNTHEYATTRSNVSTLIDSWRRQLSVEAVRVVETHCWPLMDLMRYTPVFRQS